MSNSGSGGRHVIAVLNMPRKMGDKIIKTKFIVQKLTGNTDFPTPFPINVTSLSQLSTDITTLDAAETDAQNHSKGAVPVRDAALEVVIKGLKSLMTMVQLKADSDPATAEAVIQNAGFDVKSTNVRQKQGNTAVSDLVPGLVELTADGSGAHEWQMSKDQVAILYLPSTSVANTNVQNLISGDEWYFRNRKIDALGGGNPWSPWIKVRVM